MPLNGFNIGRDVTLNLITDLGSMRLALVTSFSSKQENIDQEIKGLDGITRRLRYFNGWTGRLTVERQDSALDDYFARMEDGYYAGLNEAPVSISETIQENSGALTQWRYIGCLLKYDDAGEKRGDQSIKQSLSFIAFRRRKVT